MKNFFIFILFACFIISLRAMDVGGKAPALKIANWLKNDRVVLYPKSEEERKNNKDAIYVIFFFATWSDTTPNVINFVNEQVDYLKEINVKFIGISTESEAKIRECMRKYPDIKFHLGVDDKSKTWNDYMEDPAVPMFFIIGSDKKLIWKGSPVEVQKVLLDVIGGTFDPKKQKELESIHSDLSKAVQTFDFDAQMKSVNAALKIDPADRMSVEIKIDDYIKNNKIEECLNFLKETRKASGSNKYLLYFFYMSELDISRGIIDEKGRSYIDRLSGEYLQTFQNTPRALNIFAVRLMQIPFEITSLKYALDMSQKAVEVQKYIASTSEQLGVYMGTEAKACYLLGKIDKAVDIQKASINYFKNEDAKRAAKLLLEFYQNSKELNSKLFSPNH